MRFTQGDNCARGNFCQTDEGLGYPLHSGNTPEPPSPGSPQAQELMNSYDDQYIDDLWQCMVDEPTPTLPPIPLVEEEKEEESESESEDYQDLFDDLLNTQTGGGANENAPTDANSAEDYFVIENVETRNCPKFHAKQLVFKTTIHNRPRENIEEAVAVANTSIRRLLQHVLQELQAGNTDYVRLVERGQRLSQVCGPRTNRSVRCEALDSQELVSVKKSVVPIKKTEDGSCAFHAIVVGKWMAEGHPRHELTVRQEEEQAQALCTRSGLRWGVCGRVELFRLQEVLKEEGVRLHVYYHDLNCIGFAGDLTEFGSQKPTCDVYLFHHDEHYDVITTMTGFLKKNYFCPECDVGYSEKSKHKCRPFCECCYENNRQLFSRSGSVDLLPHVSPSFQIGRVLCQPHSCHFTSSTRPSGTLECVSTVPTVCRLSESSRFAQETPRSTRSHFSPVWRTTMYSLPSMGIVGPPMPRSTVGDRRERWKRYGPVHFF
ncbi:hypothetical protein QZH41_007803 [Actinostola sp. cb2023]|nr:hypothetical protein QZH41_007803 [Actinostola sp. cb2023]